MKEIDTWIGEGRFVVRLTRMVGGIATTSRLEGRGDVDSAGRIKALRDSAAA